MAFFWCPVGLGIYPTGRRNDVQIDLNDRRIFTQPNPTLNFVAATSHASPDELLVNLAALLTGIAAALLVKALFVKPAEPDATAELLRD